MSADEMPWGKRPVDTWLLVVSVLFAAFACCVVTRISAWAYLVIFAGFGVLNLLVLAARSTFWYRCWRETQETPR